jgi:coenzyme F420-reducing hydrogenase beta subunit
MKIVNNDLCIGCGVCAQRCPDQRLVMRFNDFGEYNPFQEAECPTSCGLCLKVCPFARGNPDEDIIGRDLFGDIPGIFHYPETGYVLDCHVGHAHLTRDRGSSGGMASWFLSTLIRQKIIDHVVAVVPGKDPGTLYAFDVLDTAEQVLSSAGSAYYPVELSGVLDRIEKKPGRYAVIGLPCFIKALRLASRKKKVLQDRIVVAAGLVCGQLKSSHYTEYLAELSGVSPPLVTAHFRGKSPEKPADNYFFSCRNTEGDGGRLFWDEGVSRAWGNRWFTPNACNYCDDIFAECADVTFMDAWLPEYSQDYRGTSLVLVRSGLVQPILRKGILDGELSVQGIGVREVINSQAGVILEKRAHLSCRLSRPAGDGQVIPEKRTFPSVRPAFLQKRKVQLMETMRTVSRTLWAEQRYRGPGGLLQFNAEMDRYLRKVTMWERFSWTVLFPGRAFRFLQRKVGR